MVTRQQISSAIANDKIVTTYAKAKETSRHLDYVVNLAKTPTLANKRLILSILIDVNNKTAVELMRKVVDMAAKKYAARNGGYTKVLKLGARAGDNTEEAILTFC
jgi:large subunit ribosomal protein L17